MLIKGCLEWQRGGLVAPSSVIAATEDLFHQLDVIGRFMEERLERDLGAFTFTSEISKAFTSFALENGENLVHVDERKLIGEIKERGCYEPGTKRNEQGQQLRGLRGVKLKASTDTDTSVTRVTHVP